MNIPAVLRACRLPLLVCSPLLTASAQQVATVPTGATATGVVEVPYSEIGRVERIDGPAKKSYVVRASLPLGSKLTGQKVQLAIEDSNPGGTSTRHLTINTGRYKTVAQMDEFIADILRRFITGPDVPGKELGKIGGLRYGGEIHFIAESADSLRYDITTPDGPAEGGGRLTRTDIRAFLAILSGPRPALQTAAGG